jgi:hypothetical protein
MADRKSKVRSRARSLTVAALLGVFIIGVVLAVASHFLPGRLSVTLRRALDRQGTRRP